MKKICVVTGTRADYGLMYHTMNRIKHEKGMQLQVCVCGMHLSPEFGLTYKQIELDGFQIHAKVEMLLSSDTAVGISKSIGLGVSGFADAFSNLEPDMILVLGDRFEILAACTAAMIANIPIAHCHGGEATEGLIDEAIRHSVTKMSHLHFTSTEVYRKRVIQLGEQPERVFHVGALGIENINKLQKLNRESLQKELGIRFDKYNFLITFHPVTLEHATAGEQFLALLRALDQILDAFLLFTKPNADTNGRIIIKMIDEYIQKNPHKSVAFTSMGQQKYLSCIPFMDAVIGNSSSGLIEVPSFKIPTINIGDRQKGRIAGTSVISCDSAQASIAGAIHKAISKEFKAFMKTTSNPYGESNASEYIVDILKRQDLKNLLKKTFYNLPH